MATVIKSIPPSTNQTTANPAVTTLSAGNIVDVVLQDAVTAAPSDLVILEHGTSGTPVAAASVASAFGSRLLFKLDDTINNKQLAAGLNAFWRAVNAAVGGCAGSLSVLVQSAGNFLEGLRINDYATQILKGTVTNPGLSAQIDNRHGLGFDGSDRGFLGHTSVQVLTWDSSAGTPRIGYNGAAPVAKASITGSRGGNAALADLLTKGATAGLWTDGTSA